MARRNDNRMTVYDLMERRGVFDSNPANIDARDSEGLSIYKKQEFPKMVYAPDGAQRVTVAAEVIATPLGPKFVGEQKELVNKTVKNQEELDAALAEGWHTDPSHARAVAEGKEIPKTSAQTIEELEAKIAALQAERAQAADAALNKAQAAGATVKGAKGAPGASS